MVVVEPTSTGKERGMNRSNRSTVVVVVVTVSVSAFAVLVCGRFWAYGCLAPFDQAGMIEDYKADPIFNAAPEDGRLLEQSLLTNACDAATDGNSGTGYPAFAEASRRYGTAAAYSVAQLRQRFDQAAAAGRWHIVEAERYTHPGDPPVWSMDERVTYCKQTGSRRSLAVLSSFVGNDPPDPGLVVTLTADRDGSNCGELR
jgi:hypothetical protein